MEITIRINTGNAAFHAEGDDDCDAAAFEVARILRELATSAESNGVDCAAFYGQPLRDANGNRCGSVEVA